MAERKPDRLTPELRLVVALVKDAVADARRGDAEAARWLRGRACEVLLMWCGVDQDAMLRRLAD